MCYGVWWVWWAAPGRARGARFLRAPWSEPFVFWDKGCATWLREYTEEHWEKIAWTYKSLDKYLFYQHARKKRLSFWGEGLFSNYNVNGLKGTIKLKGLTLVYFITFFQWMNDENPSLEKTMTALDKNLDQAEKFGKFFL